MGIRSIATTVVATVLASLLAACGGGPDVPVEEVAADKFAPGSRMAELAVAGTISVGVSYDQPGLGLRDTTSEPPTGMDVEIAKLLIADLGIDPQDTDKVNYEETLPDDRQPYLEAGRVDLVLASYPITEADRDVVGQTGPYLLTGVQVMVPASSTVTGIEDLADQPVCSVIGSTSFSIAVDTGALGAPAETFSRCAEHVLDGTVPAMAADGSVLLGLAAEHEDELKVVGDRLSEERIGVGYDLEHPEMCEWINGVLATAFEDGSWAAAFEATLGEGAVPDPPSLDSCPTP